MQKLVEKIALKLGVSPEGFKRYFANTSWLFVEKIIRLVIGFFVGVWVARYLGPSRFGLLSYARSFVALFSIFTTLGLEEIVVRELVRHEEKRYVLLGTSLFLKLLGASLMLGIIAFVVEIFSEDTLSKMLIFIIAFSALFRSFEVIRFYFQAKVQGKYISLAGIISLILSSAFKIYLIYTKAALIWFAVAAVVDTVTLMFAYFFFTYIHQVFLAGGLLKM